MVAVLRSLPVTWPVIVAVLAVPRAGPLGFALVTRSSVVCDSVIVVEGQARRRNAARSCVPSARKYWLPAAVAVVWNPLATPDSAPDASPDGVAGAELVGGALVVGGLVVGSLVVELVRGVGLGAVRGAEEVWLVDGLEPFPLSSVRTRIAAITPPASTSTTMIVTMMAVRLPEDGGPGGRGGWART